MDAHKQMARLVDSVQPHCDEPITAAMTCSHAGSMGMALFSKLTGGRELAEHTSDLPNPVFLAVGSNSIYAFDYKPRGFKFKIKDEVARWPRRDLEVAVEETPRMAYFTMTTASGEIYPMEVATVMGAKDVVDMFLAALGTG
jgi:hypothetical protein